MVQLGLAERHKPYDQCLVQGTVIGTAKVVVIFQAHGPGPPSGVVKPKTAPNGAPIGLAQTRALYMTLGAY